MKYQVKLQDNIGLYSQNTVPANINEITSIEKELGILIPMAIKEFFLLVGNDYDYLWDGGGADKISRLIYNKNLAIKLLNECGVFFSRDYFVFSSYSGDQFMFVYLDEGDDPPVYRFETELFYCGDDYMPGSSTWSFPKGVSKIADSFSEMINNVVTNKIKQQNN
ncbi:SMI1/KNR4 family protein [Flavobacterium columnare]|uniref:SMI1/KNR4 family protein n=1 Tax=Flavobacterium columnare TaxID=996 RepID=UPI004034EB5F